MPHTLIIRRKLEDYFDKTGISDKNIEADLETFSEKIKSGILGEYIFDKNCQIFALYAFRKNLINLAEFCSLSMISSLVEDHTELKLSYAKIDTITKHSLILPSTENTIAINYIKKGLRIGESEFIDERKFEKIISQSMKFSNFERAFFTVELEDYKYWPTMLQILSEYGKFFRPILVNGKNFLLLPSFSLRKVIIKVVFGENNFCDPVPVIGSVDIKSFLKFGKFGKRVISYNFPKTEIMKDADLIFTGKLFYTEHDWLHIEEISMISKRNRILFSKINELYFQQHYKLKNNGSAECRIFLFGDMEFQIYKALWHSCFNKYGFNHEHTIKWFDSIRYSMMSLILLEVLGLPICFQLTTFETLSLEKILFGKNSEDLKAILVTSPEQLELLQYKWNQDMDIFIKKLFAYFFINRKELIEKYNFDPKKLDWSLKLNETRDILDFCIKTVPCFHKLSFMEIQSIFKKFNDYSLICEKHLENLLLLYAAEDNLKSDRKLIKKISAHWKDPEPAFSFKTHYLESLEFHIGKGVSFNVKFLDIP